MLRRRVGDNVKKLIHTDDVCQKRIADYKRNGVKNTQLQPFLSDFFPVPGHFCQPSLLLRIALDQILNFAKYHFHKNSLRANPSTK